MKETMTSTLTEASRPALFDNPPAPGFTLWYRPSTGRAAWEAVAHADTHAGGVDAIGIGGRKNGRWLILPTGKEP